MKVLVTLSCVLALGAAQYVGYPYSAYNPYYYPYAAGTYSAVPYAAVPAASVSSQYHAQDELGQFNYGYADGLSTKSEVRGLNGVTAGQYSYLDANGEVQTVSYTADDVNGFRVKATNLPVAPVADLEAPVFDLKAPVFDGVAPEPVQDTPEVAAAKAEFAQLYADAAAAAEAAPDTDAETETAEPAEEQESARRRRSAVLLPALAKATFKTASLDAVEADTPADTTLLKIQEKEHEAYVHTYAAAPAFTYAAAPAITYSAPVVQKVEVKHVAAPITYAAAPAIHYTAPAITYSAPIVKKVEVKQVEAPITYAAAPFTYGYGLHPYGLGSPFVYSVAAAEEEKPAEEETAVVSAERRKRSAVLVPALAKATFKTASLDKVEADTPADTTLLKLTEKEHEAVIPTYAAAPITYTAPVFRYAAPAITYSAPVVKQVEVKHVAAPITYSAVPFPYAYGLGSPLVYTVAAQTAEVEEKAE